MSDEWMTADEAALALGVSRTTLYAYVSRGLVRSEATEGAPQRRYRRREVERLALERGRARAPAQVARGSLDWGRPILDSGVTLIEQGRLYYHGQDAVDLSRQATLEEVAALLLGCTPDDLVAGALPRVAAPTLRTLDGLDPVAGCTAGFAWLQAQAQAPARARAQAQAQDHAQAQAEAQAQAAHCGHLLRLMTAVVTRRAPTRDLAHQQLAQAWSLDDAAASVVRQALVLCADHELNASGFAARCVASTGADLGACVTAGLAALSGKRHCGVTAAIEALWQRSDAARGANALDRLVEASLAGIDADTAGVPGQYVPGFGHRLYPDGDPRAIALLARLPRGHRNERLLAAVQARTGQHPSIDYALVAMRRSLGLAAGDAYRVFALGRTAGWLAHAVEQGRSDTLIRPRANYVGPQPVREAAPAGSLEALPSRVIRRR